jgi:hypothetical protein
VRLSAGRLTLALGLLVSAGLLAAGGDWWGLAIGTSQVGLAAAIALRPSSPWPPAWTVLAALPAPVAAARHWAAHLPGACKCARLPHPPPGLVSLTGLAVAVDIGLLAVALAVTAASRTAKVGKLAP